MSFSVAKIIVGSKSFDLIKDFPHDVNVWKKGACKILLRKIQISSFSRNELNILRETSHENIQKLFDSTVDSKAFYLALEYGVTLQEYLEKEDKSKTKNFERVLELFRQSTEGLKYLHSLNHVHKNLIPENILVERNENQAKLANFCLPQEERSTANVRFQINFI